MPGRDIMEGETRNQMMQNLFGYQSEEEEEEDVDSEHEAAVPHPTYPSDEGEGEAEFEGDGEIEGQGEVEGESEVELHDVDPVLGDSEGERVATSPEREMSDQRMENKGKYEESEEEEYGQKVVPSGRRDTFASVSGDSENRYSAEDNDGEDVVHARNRRLENEPVDHEAVRVVFGDSDEDEQDDYGIQNEIQNDAHRSPVEEEDGYEKELRPEDMVRDDILYESDDENREIKQKKPTGPPLEIEVALQRPPGLPERMNIIKVSNIMGIEPKLFDPKTYVEENNFVTDESGAKKRIRLENNIVRWRHVRHPDGSISYESNARFVEWKDGTMQLLIGNEVLDLSVQEANHDQTHLFLQREKGILQSQGRLLKKMRFMPSSLSSKSHRLLTALVDSRHKKVYKVKNCITDIDPEKEKEEKEKAEGQTIRANVLLHRKREKVTRKYVPPADRGRQLSPGFLEDALEEDDEDYYGSGRIASRNRFDEDMELEAQAERRIMNAKRGHKDIRYKSSLSASRMSRRLADEYSESEGEEEPEYETEGEDIEQSPSNKRGEDLDNEDEYDEEQEEENAGGVKESEKEEEARSRGKEPGNKRAKVDSDADSPPVRKMNRRKAVVYDSDDED